MSSNSDNAEAPGWSRWGLGIGFLIIGIIGISLAGAILLTPLSPAAQQNDANMGHYLVPPFLMGISSIPVLTGLLLLKVRWFLAIGAFLLSLLAAYAYGQIRLFPHDPAAPGTYDVLVYGGGVILLSLVLVESVAVRWVLTRSNRQRTSA